MQVVADALNQRWSGQARAHFLPEYYQEDIWSFDYLKSIGIRQMPDVKSATRAGIHDDYHYESIIATVNPDHIRAGRRMKAGTFPINGVDMRPLQKTVKNGKLLVEYRVGITVRALEKSMQRFKAVPAAVAPAPAAP
jgi:hypothetical protein